MIVADGLPHPLLPSLWDTNLPQLSVLTLHQVQRLVQLAASAAAIGLAALTQPLRQSAAKEPAVEGEASKLGAKVSLERRKLGAMEVVGADPNIITGCDPGAAASYRDAA